MICAAFIDKKRLARLTCFESYDTCVPAVLVVGSRREKYHLITKIKFR
jgi:hypothetical protein